MKRIPPPGLVAIIPLLLLGASCAGKQSSAPATSVPRSGAATSRTVSASNDPNSVPSIAQREVIRRQEMIRQMDEAAIKASQRMAEDDLEGAVEGYRRAIGQ